MSSVASHVVKTNLDLVVAHIAPISSPTFLFLLDVSYNRPAETVSPVLRRSLRNRATPCFEIVHLVDDLDKRTRCAIGRPL